MTNFSIDYRKKEEISEFSVKAALTGDKDRREHPQL